MNKKLMLVLAMLLVASAAFAEQNPTGQGSTVLNGGIIEVYGGFTGSGPNNRGGPGLGRHGLQDANTHLPIGCESCHLSHTSSTYGKSFMWAWRNVPTNIATYVTATNPSGALVTPSGTTGNARSMLCFSCHDGTSAGSNGITAAVLYTAAPYPLINTVGGVGSLGSEHPVDAIVPTTSDYVQPAVLASLGMYGTAATIGVDALPLWDTAYHVECGTCHDVHNDYTANNGANGGIPFLRVANTNGTYLCRECHNAQ